MYYILEIQEQNDGTAGTLIYKENTRNEALSKYYDILHYAAISSVPVHTAVLIENDGRYIARESFTHRGENG